MAGLEQLEEPKPSIPVETGRPVALVRTTEDGVPSAGVVIVGLVNVLFVKVCEPDKVTTVESIANEDPVNVNPVPAVYVPAPENCVNSMASEPRVATSFTCTQPVFAF